MPYVIGLMRSCKRDLAKYRNSPDMLIVDLDKNRFIYDTRPVNSTAATAASNANGPTTCRILPESIVKALKIDLYNLMHNSRLPNDYEKNVELCRIFLKVFVKTLGNYANYIVACDEKDNDDLSTDQYKFLVIFFLSPNYLDIQSRL